MLVFFRECFLFFHCILFFWYLTIGRIESIKLFINIYGDRLTMMSSKKKVELIDNVAWDEVMSIDDLKTKNDREHKHAQEEEKMDYSWFLKE